MRKPAGVMVGLMLLAACSTANAGGQPTSGPLGSGHLLPASNLNHECSPLTRHGHTYSTAESGWLVVTNTTGSPFTISQVSLVRPRGIKVTGAEVEALSAKGGFTMLGNWAGPPRTYNAFTRQTMTKARPASGATIKPGQRLQVILDLAFRPGHGGSSGPVKVTYSNSDGTSYVLYGQTRFTFTARASCF